MAERLIDAELLKHTTKRLIKEQEQDGFYPKSWDEEVIAFKCLIDGMPTIEAKPVVRAHWEQVITVVKKIHEYEQEDIQYRCDHCGHIVDDFENYCGGCGAQMFEGVKIPVISMEDVPKIMEEMENNA